MPPASRQCPRCEAERLLPPRASEDQAPCPECGQLRGTAATAAKPSSSPAARRPGNIPFPISELPPANYSALPDAVAREPGPRETGPLQSEPQPVRSLRRDRVKWENAERRRLQKNTVLIFGGLLILLAALLVLVSL